MLTNRRGRVTRTELQQAVAIDGRGRVAPFAASLLALVLLAGCTHVIEPGIAFEPGSGRYDFCEPQRCSGSRVAADPEAGDQVTIRYLGAGGLFVGWRGEAVLIGPFFSNPGRLRVLAGDIRWRADDVRRALAPHSGVEVGAILAGHSHYDHIGDLPVIAEEHAERARLFLNRSGVAALKPYPDLVARTRELEAIENRWTRLEDAKGTLLPFRLLALPSDHAPHAAGLLVMDGETRPLGREWPKTRYWKLKTGRTYAFILDLLDDSGAAGGEPPVRFRILYQDAASTGLAAALPGALAGGPPVDLAVLCMPSAHLVPPYPERVLRESKPAHALIIHYEDFFRPWGRSAPFAPFLTRARAESFLKRADGVLQSVPPARPVVPKAGVPGPGTLCGPHTERWTMPLVGEWLVFE